MTRTAKNILPEKTPRQRRIRLMNSSPNAVSNAVFRHSLGSSFKLGLILVCLRCDPASHVFFWLGRAFENETANNKKIHFRIHKAAVGIVRRANDWLAAYIK